jgi:hypothetical protein
MKILNKFTFYRYLFGSGGYLWENPWTGILL